MESQVQTFSRECELLFRKASALEAERVQLKRLLNEKRHLLEAKEAECTNLATALANLQENLEVCQGAHYTSICCCLVKQSFDGCSYLLLPETPLLPAYLRMLSR